jgi:predicted phage terminase large subunit-like protein
MPEIKSVASGGKDQRRAVALQSYNELLAHFPQKMYWFLSQKEPYKPHEWQAAFHSANKDGKLLRFRHLVAGRRGGKTLSAAWEVVFYCLHPEVFHRDAHGIDSYRALWVWVLAKDHEVGFPARQAILQVLDNAGLMPNKDYKYNKTEKKIEFENGTLLQFKSADDPQSLRGAGLDLLWIDEAAFVPNRDAWDVVRPALSDKIGRVITTTTPHGKNWFWEEFWGKEAVKDENQFRVEYTTLDNHFLPGLKEEWDYAKNHLHPMIFKQEYMASFDAMSGIALSGDWLKFFTTGEAGVGEIRLPRDEKGNVKLRKFIGVDPAISLSDKADYFAMALIGLTEDNSQAFLLDTYKDRIQFPEQIDKIREWFLQYRPELIGIESVAYQRALEQMANRMEGFPGIVPVMSRSKKTDRILGLGPLFKIGKVRVHKNHKDFVDEWVGYDPAVKNPRDDLLDAVEIALGVAGVLLPSMSFNPDLSDDLPKGMSLTEEAALQIKERRNVYPYDPDLGEMA